MINLSIASVAGSGDRGFYGLIWGALESGFFGKKWVFGEGEKWAAEAVYPQSMRKWERPHRLQ